MDRREWQVGIVGTFDVENYGDLLFPLIAQAELAERLGAVKLHCFSYEARTAEEWPFPVTSLTELPRLVSGLDALVVGGGFLIRFDKGVAPGYGPPPGIHHPTGYWLSPALIALQHDVPVLWNTPGADYQDFPAWADPLMELAFSSSAYIAVRDEPSRAALARFVDPDRIAVVPDTAFGVGRLQLRESNAAGPAGPYIIIQGVRTIGATQRFLKRHADRLRGYQLLALAVGPVNSDDTSVLDPDLPGLVTLPEWPHPLSMAELIRHADAVIGPSFHLAITALTAGVPVFSPVDLSLWKYPGLAGFETIYPAPGEDGDDPERFFSRLGRTEVPPRVGAALGRLAEHWDRMAEVIRGGRGADTCTSTAVGRFWQTLPDVLEAAALKSEAAARKNDTERKAAARMHEAELKAMALMHEAERNVAALRNETEIAARDRRIAELEESTSWKVTAPFRFIGRRLGR